MKKYENVTTPTFAHIEDAEAAFEAQSGLINRGFAETHWKAICNAAVADLGEGRAQTEVLRRMAESAETFAATLRNGRDEVGAAMFVGRAAGLSDAAELLSTPIEQQASNILVPHD